MVKEDIIVRASQRLFPSLWSRDAPTQKEDFIVRASQRLFPHLWVRDVAKKPCELKAENVEIDKAA